MPPIAADIDFMARALELADEAARSGETPVGAIIVDPSTQTIVAEGRNCSIGDRDPTGHAEIAALRAAARVLGNYRLTGLTLYVTLEPCAMCAGAISHARIGRLVYGAGDVKGGAIDNGVRFFEHPTCHWKPEVCGGVEAEQAGDLLRRFFRDRRTKA